MKSVFYENLGKICNEFLSEKNFANIESIYNQNDTITLSLNSKKSTDEILYIIFWYYQKEGGGKYFFYKKISHGFFTIEKSSGIIIDYTIEDNISSLSFHETMSKFFKFEILSLYQQLIKMTKPLIN